MPRALPTADGQETRFPLIEPMNENWRVFEAGGMLHALTPVYPHVAAIQDPTDEIVPTTGKHEYFVRPRHFRCRALQAAVDDRAWRESAARAARDIVRRDHTLEHTVQAWRSAIEQSLAGARSAVAPAHQPRPPGVAGAGPALSAARSSSSTQRQSPGAKSAASCSVPKRLRCSVCTRLPTAASMRLTW